MSKENKKEYDYYSFGIIISVLFIILSVVWVALKNICSDDNVDDMTWVG